jgi:hypothetical protein
MLDVQRALSRADEGLSQLNIPELLPNLHEIGVHIKRHILGGSHTVVTYPPLLSLDKNRELHFTTLGRLFEDELLAMFYSPSVQELLRDQP